VDPALVPGILLVNRPVNNPAPSLIDIAPTVLKFFGIPIPSYMRGQPLV
jgi:bisphosphoglycerate-independent phosphoglycerate mutase (AlkP superfamily)